MDQITFKNELRAIFAAHGKIVPSDAVALAVWKRVEEFPDAFMTFAATQLADYEKLPSNLGFELARVLYPLWRSRMDQQNTRRVCCPDCDRHMPGFFQAWKRDEAGRLRSVLCRCLCNDDPVFENMPRMSKAFAGQQGFSVMPRTWKGGPAGFERSISA